MAYTNTTIDSDEKVKMINMSKKKLSNKSKKKIKHNEVWFCVKSIRFI